MTLLIGIMADSHGQAGAIQAAVDLLKSRNCRSLYHLGDVCDSNCPESVAACLKPLRKHNVITLKGNNDHVIVAGQIGRQVPTLPQADLKYLQDLPLAAAYQNAIFTHSLPFHEELGLSSMIGNMGETEVRRCLDKFPQHIIFRGHSHSAELIRLRRRRIECGALKAGQKIDLNRRLPCVVTCGALTQGRCMLWHPQRNRVECLSLG